MNPLKKINQISIPQSYRHPLPKDNGTTMKPLDNMRNNQDNCTKTDMKGKGQGIGFQKTGSPTSYLSHEESGSRQERPDGNCMGKNMQWNRDVKGSTDEMRIDERKLHPTQPNYLTKEKKEASKGTVGQYRELAEGENFLKVITEDNSKKEAKGRFKMELSDISETTSEVFHPRGTVIQPSMTGRVQGGPRVEEKIKPQQVVQTKKQELDGIRMINNSQGKGVGVIRTSDNAFTEQLKKFPLNELTMTKKGDFDKRYNLTKSYLDLCGKANQDPLRYYHENCDLGQQIIARNVQENSQRNNLRGVNDKNALEELEEFPLEELVITNKGLFDKRYKLTKQYLELCERAGQDPVEYYNKIMA